MSANAEQAYRAAWPGMPVDPNDPSDARSEAARLAVMNALEPYVTAATTGDEISDLVCGAYLGTVMSLIAVFPVSDDQHRRLLSTLVEILPWAIDSTRLGLGLGPLPKGAQ